MAPSINGIRSRYFSYLCGVMLLYNAGRESLSNNVFLFLLVLMTVSASATACWLCFMAAKDALSAEVAAKI